MQEVTSSTLVFSTPKRDRRISTVAFFLRFDVRSVPRVRKAIRRKKYAFAADCIRHYALCTEGGIYLDTDFEIRQAFDELLASRLFAVVGVNEEVLARNIEEAKSRPGISPVSSRRRCPYPCRWIRALRCGPK